MHDIACLHSSFSIRTIDNDTRLKWSSPPKNILVVHKMDDPVVLSGLKCVVYFLLKHFQANVLLEEASINALRMEIDFEPILSSHLKIDGLGVKNSLDGSQNYDFSGDWESFPTVWSNDIEWQYFPNSSIVVFGRALATQHQLTDMVICMGGDGTLLHVGSIFQNTVPPVLAFYMGSLGFLTPFNFDSFPSILKQFCTEGGPCLLRSRQCCRLFRRQHSENPGLENGSTQSIPTCYHILNEITFSRGNCPYLCNLLLSVDGKCVASIQGDGLLVSTPTGSTAYSLSAGASIINAAVPAILITPLNPHTLSCRPLVLPIGTRLEVSIDPEARSDSIHLSNDGRLSHRYLLYKGDRVVITASHYPVPCFCPETQVADWFCDLAHSLNWNVRHQQNRFDETRFIPKPFNNGPAIGRNKSYD